MTYIPYLGTFFFSRYPSVALARNNTRLLRQKTGGACLYMPQDDHWQASFEVTPPQKSLFFRGQKNESSPLKSAVSDPKFWRFLFFRRKFCHAVLDSREHQGLPPD